MDFFQQQDQARLQTKRLTALFIVAVLLIMMLVNLVVVFGLFKLQSVGGSSLDRLERELNEETFWYYLTKIGRAHV